MIVDSSGCIGFDCINSESFGLYTIRFKEINLRIKFQDTSTPFSFPTNGEQIAVSDSETEGVKKFCKN